jgi:hypothetical protein
MHRKPKIHVILLYPNPHAKKLAWKVTC